MMLLGIDPGKQTGIAVFRDGKLTGLHTSDPLAMISFIRAEPPGRIIFEDSRSARPEICKAHGNIKMFELKFHKKIVAEINRIGAQPIELPPVRGARDHQHLFGRRRTGKLMQSLEEKKDANSRHHQNGEHRREDGGMSRRLFPAAFRSLDQRRVDEPLLHFLGNGDLAG